MDFIKQKVMNLKCLIIEISNVNDPDGGVANADDGIGDADKGGGDNDGK